MNTSSFDPPRFVPMFWDMHCGAPAAPVKAAAARRQCCIGDNMVCYSAREGFRSIPQPRHGPCLHPTPLAYAQKVFLTPGEVWQMHSAVPLPTAQMTYVKRAPPKLRRQTTQHLIRAHTFCLTPTCAVSGERRHVGAAPTRNQEAQQVLLSKH